MSGWLVLATAWAVVVAVIDWRRQRLAPAWLWAGLIIAVTGWWLAGALVTEGLWRLAAGGLGVAVTLPGWQLGLVGGADVKAHGVVGLATGVAGMVETWLLAGVLFGLLALASRLRGGAGQRLAYLPALSTAWVAWLWTGPWGLAEWQS